ncbi:hypothetical protein NDU88_001519 [Pleurodeles waltl]|uniref:Uncharacterized protein n=1 Tax=Pleurodeles waltl TaxID=8319 RepID=A0AAV7U858_PLEWA|nr:hypothetical protein NDU88_001519 [Pleurodeles waltl]
MTRGLLLRCPLMREEPRPGYSPHQIREVAGADRARLRVANSGLPTPDDPWLTLRCTVMGPRTGFSANWRHLRPLHRRNTVPLSQSYSEDPP